MLKFMHVNKNFDVFSKKKHTKKKYKMIVAIICSATHIKPKFYTFMASCNYIFYSCEAQDRNLDNKNIIAGLI